ncbi:MAG: DNRLRE domain-containing protein [Ketobacteraceae bacterium]|nr:DNRLRE domain-containing protein [Ketobacteraceae bacterium]
MGTKRRSASINHSRKHTILPRLTVAAAAAFAATACTPPSNIFTPVSGTDFNASTGTVVIQGLTATTSLCYTTDGSEPVWNGGTCSGGSTQRIPGPVVYAQIALTCEGQTGSSVQRTIKVTYDWSGTPGQTQTGVYYLDCDGSGGDGGTGGGDDGTGGGDDGTGGGDDGTGGGSGGDPQNLTLTPSADAYVDNSAGSQNFGFDSTLLVDQAPDELHTYMRFSVPALTGTVQSATLRLYGTNPSPNGPKIYITGNTWSEGGITWNNKPAPSDTPVADIQGSTSTGWLDIDVTSAVTSQGNLSFVLIPDDIDGYDFDSREGANPPELVVVTGEGGGTGGGDTGGGDSATGTNAMAVGERLYNNEYLVSSNGLYRFYLQGDGNLVLRDWQTRASMWSSGTHGDNGTNLRLQGDGNLVLYTDSSSAVWASDTVGSGADELRLGDDGTLALYQGNSVVWSVGGSGDTGGGDTGGGSGSITHIGTTEAYDSDGQNLRIARPSGTRSGDLMVLILHRTDDYLPLRVSGWNRAGAECFKRDNGYNCVTYDDCTDWLNSNICRTFGSYGQGGRDLAQVVFYKRAGSSEPSSYEFDLNPDSSGHPGWAILTTLRGANTSDPIRDWANEGCDNNADSLFPSVYGVAGDMVLLSQSFDDAIAQSKFNPPDGTTSFGYVSQSDEAGFLFGGILDSTGETGSMKTHGDGGPNCKDALVSLTIKPE